MGVPLRVARYLCVSRIDQHSQLQEDETADFIQRWGWELVGIYTDHGVVGSRAKRPAPLARPAPQKNLKNFL